MPGAGGVLNDTGTAFSRDGCAATTVPRLGGVGTEEAGRFQFGGPERHRAPGPEARRVIGGSWGHWWLKTPLPGIGWCNRPHMTGLDGLGTDSANTGGRHDRWDAMRLAFMLHRHPGTDPAGWPRAPDVLRMATENGARVLGIDAGCLRPGALADLVLVRRTDAATLLLAGRVLAFDEDAVLAEAAALRAEVLDRAAPRLGDVRAATQETEPWTSACSSPSATTAG